MATEFTPEKAQYQLTELLGEEMAAGLSVNYTEGGGMRITVTRPEGSPYSPDFVMRAVRIILEMPGGNATKAMSPTASLIVPNMKERLEAIEQNPFVIATHNQTFWRQELERLGVGVEGVKQFGKTVHVVLPESERDRFPALFSQASVVPNVFSASTVTMEFPWVSDFEAALATEGTRQRNIASGTGGHLASRIKEQRDQRDWCKA